MLLLPLRRPLIAFCYELVWCVGLCRWWLGWMFQEVMQSVGDLSPPPTHPPTRAFGWYLKGWAPRSLLWVFLVWADMSYSFWVDKLAFLASYLLLMARDTRWRWDEPWSSMIASPQKRDSMRTMRTTCSIQDECVVEVMNMWEGCRWRDVLVKYINKNLRFTGWCDYPLNFINLFGKRI